MSHALSLLGHNLLVVYNIRRKNVNQRIANHFQFRFRINNTVSDIEDSTLLVRYYGVQWIVNAGNVFRH